MSYTELENKVWKMGSCSCCGACSAVCPGRTITLTEHGPLYEGYCRELEGIPCDACNNSCARIMEPSPVHTQRTIYAARSVRPVLHAQSGGAVTALLASALDTGMIDGAVILKADRITKTSTSVVVRDSHDLFNASGSRYSWGNTLEALGNAVKLGYKKLAVVGMPCTIQSMRRIMTSDLDVLQCYGKCINLTVGLFCSAIFKSLEQTVSGKLDIPVQQIRRIEISGNIRVFLDDREETIPIAALKTCILPGCSHCRDFSAQFADISAGETGSKKGFTTLIVRTSGGQAVLQSAIAQRCLELSDEIHHEDIRIKEEEKACAQ